MIGITVVFLGLYLWFTTFPGRPAGDAYRYFTEGEIVSARAYASASRMVSAINFPLSSLSLSGLQWERQDGIFQTGVKRWLAGIP